MSGSSTTRTRREIRRAVGPAAVQTLDAHADALREHGNLLNRIRLDVVDLAKDHAVLKQDVTVLTSLATGTLAELRRLSDRGVWGRLGWLVFGR